jgi:hypothetical protein
MKVQGRGFIHDWDTKKMDSKILLIVQDKNNSCGVGDFSHVYIIVHEYLGLQVKTQKNANMGFIFIFLHDYFLHM